MGSSQSEQPKKFCELQHPNLPGLVLNLKNDTMLASFPIQRLQELEEFEERLRKIKNFDEYYLLLPK